jgi:Ulp1 family protease
VVFIIVPAERRVECYDLIRDGNDFHYESLNVIVRFIKDSQFNNKLQVDDWSWSVRILSAPKQNNMYDCGFIICMRMHCMMKGWDLNNIPVGMYNSHLRLFMVSLTLKWRIGTKYYSVNEERP